MYIGGAAAPSIANGASTPATGASGDAVAEAMARMTLAANAPLPPLTGSSVSTAAAVNGVASTAEAVGPVSSTSVASSSSSSSGSGSTSGKKKKRKGKGK
jgi:hypothetical protein